MEINHQLQLIKDDPYLEPFQVPPSPLRNTFMISAISSTGGSLSSKATMGWIRSRRATKDTAFIARETSLSTGSGPQRPEAYPSSEISTTGRGENIYVRKYLFAHIEQLWSLDLRNWSRHPRILCLEGWGPGGFRQIRGPYSGMDKLHKAKQYYSYLRWGLRVSQQLQMEERKAKMVEWRHHHLRVPYRDGGHRVESSFVQPFPSACASEDKEAGLQGYPDHGHHRAPLLWIFWLSLLELL